MTRKLVIALSLLVPSPVKIWIYRTLLGARIGSNVRIKFGSYIVSNEIVLEDGVSIGSDVHIICGKLSVGEETVICAEVRVDGDKSLTIGKNCYIGQRTLINVTEPVTIEDGVGIGSDTSIFTHGVWVSYLEGLPRKFAPAKICRNAWIPPRCIIQPGVTVGESAMLATGAVATKDIPGGTFAGGIPATVIRNINDIKDQVDLQEKDRRTREILQAFVDHVAENTDCQPVSEDFEKGSLFRFAEKGRNYGICYQTDPISSETLKKLVPIGKGLDASVVVALQGFSLSPDELRRKYGSFEWFDLSRLVRKRSWNPFTVLVRDFFRGHYGVKFSLEQDGEN